MSCKGNPDPWAGSWALQIRPYDHRVAGEREFVPGWRRRDCLFQGPATREIVQEHHDTAAYHTARAFTGQLSTAHFISAHPSDSQKESHWSILWSLLNHKAALVQPIFREVNWNRREDVKHPKKWSEAESGPEGSCLIAKLFKYHNSKNRYHDLDIFHTPFLQKGSSEKSFQNAQYWPHVQKCGAKKDCLLLSSHLLCFLLPQNEKMQGPLHPHILG